MKKHLLGKFLILILIAVSFFTPAVARAGAWEEFTQGVVTGVTNAAINTVVVVVGALASVIQLFAGMFLDTAGYLLDMSMQLAIFGLSSIVNGNTRTAIIEGWTIFRDLANIGFVFAMLYIAINFILQSDSGSTKKLLSNVIIAAFLVNFSFFFTGIIIDTGNQFAIMFANSINQELAAATPEPAESISDFINKATKTESILATFGEWVKNMTGSFQNQISAGAGSASTAASTESDFKLTLESGLASIGAVAVMIVLGFVLIVVAFMLFARTVALILLLITSPVGFAGNILPSLKKTSDEWWESLVGNVFFLPAFLLFIYIAFKLMNSGVLDFSQTDVFSQPLIGNGTTSGAESSLLDTLATIQGSLATYAIVIGLVLGALQAAQKLSSQGSKALASLSANITSTVGGAAMGGAGFVGRQTIGRGANKLAERIENSKFATTRLGSLALSGSRGIAGSSFDARASSAFKGVASATGVGADVLGKQGESGKKGYSGLVETAIKKRVDYASKLGSRDIKGSKEDREHEAAKDTAQKAADALLAETASSTSTPATIKLKKKDLERAKADLEIKKKAYDKAKDLKKPYIEELKKNKGLFDGKVRTWIGKANEEAAEKIEKQLKEGELDKLNKSIQAALAAAKK